MGLKIGDRVKIAKPEGWLQPFRGFGEEGRKGTVTSAFIPHGCKYKRYRVEFDVKRRNAKPIVQFFDEGALLVVAEESGPA